MVTKEKKENKFASRVYELRTENDLHQKDVGADMGMSSQSISNYEKGKREPSIDTLIEFANYFNVTVDYLVGRTSK